MTSPRQSDEKLPSPGDQAPEFRLPAYPAGEVSLSDYLGKQNVILAFYPRDNTPGCTREMCSFSEDLSKFAAAGTAVLGISCDSLTAHESFSTKFNLAQKLLADVDGKVGKAYGAILEGKSNASRILFIIDKKGMIQYIINGMPDNNQLLENLTKI